MIFVTGFLRSIKLRGTLKLLLDILDFLGQVLRLLDLAPVLDRVLSAVIVWRVILPPRRIKTKLLLQFLIVDAKAAE